MGERTDDIRKEKFFFASFNRTAVNPGKHVFDEHLKFTPSPSSTVEPPELILSRTAAFFTAFTQAGGEFVKYLRIFRSIIKFVGILETF